MHFLYGIGSMYAFAVQRHLVGVLVYSSLDFALTPTIGFALIVYKFIPMSHLVFFPVLVRSVLGR